MTETSSHPPFRARLALALLCAAALALRFVGIDHGLPHRTEPDVFVVAQVEMEEPGFLEGARADDLELSREANSAYPHLMADLLASLPRADAEALRTRGEALNRAGLAFERARGLAACSGALLVLATYVLARRFLDRGPSLFAAALIATSLLSFNFSQQARPHMLVAAFATLALTAALRTRADNTLGNRLLACLAVVGAAGSLQSGVLCALPLSVSQVLLEDGGAASPRRSGRRWRRAAGLCACALLPAVLLFYPVFDPDRTVPLEQSPVVVDHLSDPSSYDGGGFARLLRDVAAYDPALLGLGAAGGLWLLGRALFPRGRPTRATSRSRDAWVVASFALPYLLVFGLYRHSTARYAIPLLPIVALLAAAGFSSALAGIRRRREVVLAACLALSLPGAACLRLALLRRAPDTSRAAASWLEEHASPTDSIWLAPGLDLPLVRSPESLANDAPHVLGVLRQPWFRFQASLDPVPAGWRWNLRTVPLVKDGRIDRTFAEKLRLDPPGAIASLGADYVVVASFSDGAAMPRNRNMRAGLEQVGAVLVAGFAPFADKLGRPRPMPYQDSGAWSTPFLEAVLRADLDGPAIEIYRLPR